MSPCRASFKRLRLIDGGPAPLAVDASADDEQHNAGRGRDAADDEDNRDAPGDDL